MYQNIVGLGKGMCVGIRLCKKELLCTYFLISMEY